MREKVMLRNSFLEYNPEQVAYITYELTNATPDFSTFLYGTRHSIVLRNTGTGKLEQINFTISGDDGRFFPEPRRLWGDIESNDYHAILVFHFENGNLSKLTASFCGNSMSRAKWQEVVKEAPYGAAATKDDLFFRAHPDLR